MTLYLRQRLAYLSQVLVGEGLVDAQVVVAPREVGGGTGLLTSTGRACNGVDGDIVLQQVLMSGGQQTELNGSGEATGIGYMLGPCYLGLVNLGQTIDIVVTALDTEVLRQVNDFDMLRNGVLLQESLTLAVTKAEEHYIYLLEGHLVGKCQVGFADKSFVDIRHQVSCVTFRVGKHNLCLRMVQQQTEKFSARVSRCT